MSKYPVGTRVRVGGSSVAPEFCGTIEGEYHDSIGNHLIRVKSDVTGKTASWFEWRIELEIPEGCEP